MKHFKFLPCLCLVIGLLVILTGCPKPANTAGTSNSNDGENPQPQVDVKPQGKMYFDYFDTVSYIYSYSGDTEEEFNRNCGEVTALLGEYHKLFDIYYSHSGVTNLKTINDNAGGDWITVDKKLVDFLLYAKELYTKTNGEMNIMMGTVLGLWHDCREAATKDPSKAHIPTNGELTEAGKHTSIDSLEINVAENKVRISDSKASIDVGALGKGYATEMAAKHLRDMGVDHYVLNIGGNIRIIGKKVNGTGWNTGIKNPQDPSTYASYITISDTSCVTSGNYERYFTVNETRYHHIIDKDTLMPADYFASVTVITPDSGLADALSTALFCMSYEDGLAMLENFPNVEVIWIAADGTQYKTDGYDNLLTPTED